MILGGDAAQRRHEAYYLAAPRLAKQFQEIRRTTERLCEPLEPEDYVVQSMADASPAKWHLAHTTWFFETFVLSQDADYRSFDPAYSYLFNSYYNAIGQRQPRAQRGLLTRPGAAEIFRYRRHVDDCVCAFMAGAAEPSQDVLRILEIGLHHEQQHQELLLTDIKHLFSLNPLRPVYRPSAEQMQVVPTKMRWFDYGEGMHEIGHAGGAFAFDNEGPRHRVFLESFALASRLSTNAEYLDFIAEGGYQRPELWLSDGWDAVKTPGWHSPMYWEQDSGTWRQMTLAGLRPIELAEPVSHISYYEADAFARWSGARLPTEAEWEVVASQAPVEGNLLESGHCHGRPASCQPLATSPSSAQPRQLYGDVWEWTASPYVPYPGYRPERGALGEYNGKFMCNQMVLRGGSCVTPRSHVRSTYRNFFPPAARWQFSGVRLARDLDEHPGQT